ncbi:MAG: DEAD/DEAH box helicase [Ectothiorhodospiraceae bacterium AqS1]|nr:DEAD/DEAH box helicase [Ectothiorhodospiraceae bacterium AqS1]
MATKDFKRLLQSLRDSSRSAGLVEQGRLFERLMKRWLSVDPLYIARFSEIRSWSEWASERSDFDGRDMGIDLVAAEREGEGFCAIQCKFHAPGTRISSAALDSFLAASNRAPFTSRMVIDTGDEWGAMARKKIEGVQPPCTVIGYAILANSPVCWPDLADDEPESLAADPTAKHRPLPHQIKAIADIGEGFAGCDRGRLIMACGTGKTFTALRLAEEMAGIGARVLYLVPSISLLQQSMRAFAEHKSIEHRYIGICSDTKAGRNDEDASLAELEIPVTTDASSIQRSLAQEKSDAMRVVFCTYQSLELIAAAQDRGAPEFDLILCDEAHRTTGIEHGRAKDKARVSPFVLVHDQNRIRGAKRLYMTATPRIYTENIKAKAGENEMRLFSMDDPKNYGPEFHRLSFSDALNKGLLSDYRVVVLAFSEAGASKSLQAHLAAEGGDIKMSDAARIAGCWRALQDPENLAGKPSAERPPMPPKPLRRAIAFTNTIGDSKRLEKHWPSIVESAQSDLPQERKEKILRCTTSHVDGQHNALDRKKKIEALKNVPLGECHILSNARCLSEGVDVPALDAVLFMAERKSVVDVVQAVGRVMRRAPGTDKEYGYIVLPVVIPAGSDPAAVLESGNEFSAVWSVLRSLRSHDERLDAEINQIALNRRLPERIIFARGDGQEQERENYELPFPPLDLPVDLIHARIVEKCGDRQYWKGWAGRVADIFKSLVVRIRGLLESEEHRDLRHRFGAFHEELKSQINNEIDFDSAIEMFAQHILTHPIFDALFDGYDFTKGNPVAQALDRLRREFDDYGLENELRGLKRFYESVRTSVANIDGIDGRQRILLELYEEFFKIAMKKDAERLGIVYTPVEVVDFILHSADHALYEEFGRRLSDEGVHIFDPFTGTGVFPVRLLQSRELIRDRDIERKYLKEIHANEIVLLAYYIGAVQIEDAYKERTGSEYTPFPGIVLTDTFNLLADKNGFAARWLPDNSERVARQREIDIEVIICNPPWSANNQNISYPDIEERVRNTYAAHSKAGNKNTLYDSYKLAIRWASDRIDKRGVIAMVTNGSWIDGNVDSGLRACFAEEFSSVHILNLRGNQRTQGEMSLREGGKVFGQGSRAPVAITLWIKNPDVRHESCRILYHDIGDYKSREEKLKLIQTKHSISGIDDWQKIVPDIHHDWINQKSESFEFAYPVISKETRAGKDEAIFKLFSRGLVTGRDAWLYNFSFDRCANHAKAMVSEYMAAMDELKNSDTDVEKIVSLHSSNTRWDVDLINNLRRGRKILHTEDRIIINEYRPFTKQYCYLDYVLMSRKYQMDKIFPDSGKADHYPPQEIALLQKNLVICVPGIGSPVPFSTLIVNRMPDLGLLSACQCIPRWCYEKKKAVKENLFESHSETIDEFERIDNITDAALQRFVAEYQDDSITKDDIFYYVYGIFHAPEYKERFAFDLKKSLPRIPFAQDFHAFVKAGRALATLHLDYETGEQYPLLTKCTDGSPEPTAEQCRMGKRKMRFADKEKKDIFIVNDFVRLEGIPPEANAYRVNGRSPLEWLIDRMYIKEHEESGIVNDPNHRFDDPRDLLALIRRLVYVSVESDRIIRALPPPFAEDPD